MRISTAQLTEIAMKALGGRNGVTAELKVGAIVRATLMEFLTDSEALIQIGHFKMKAKVDTNLQVGDRLQLLVTGEQKQGAMELKLVSPPQRGGQDKAGVTVDPSAVLKALSMPDTAESQAIVREMVLRGVPIKSEVLKAATTVLQQLPKPTSAQIATLGKMAELGIPIHASSFEALHTLDAGPKLHELLQNVQKSISNALEQDQPFPENKISRPGTTTAEGTLSKDAAQARTGSEPRVLSESTRQYLTQLSKLAHDLLQDTDLAQHPLGEKAKQLGLGFEERLANAVRRLPADSEPAVIASALQAAQEPDLETGPALKQTLLSLQASSAELTAAGLKPLTEEVGQLLRHVTGQQVMLTAGQERSDLLYQFSAVPVQVGGREQTVELHVMSRKGPGQKHIDPSNCYILFRLDLPNLGEIDIHLHIVEKVVGLRFLTGEPDNVVLEPAEQRELREKIQGVGFHLGTLKVEEKKAAENGEHHPMLPPVLTHGAFDSKF